MAAPLALSASATVASHSGPPARGERAWYSLFAHAQNLNSKPDEACVFNVNFTSRIGNRCKMFTPLPYTCVRRSVQLLATPTRMIDHSLAAIASLYTGASCPDSWMATETRQCVCRLCLSETSPNNSISLFSKRSVEKNWASRISDLLLVDLATSMDSLPPQFCSKSCRRMERLEKAVPDLTDFRRQTRESYRAVQVPRKRTKETSSNIGVTTDTRPPVKKCSSTGGRRLEFGPTSVAGGK